MRPSVSQPAAGVSAPQTLTPTDGPQEPSEEHLPFTDNWYPIQVKQTDKAGRPDIDKFRHQPLEPACVSRTLLGAKYFQCHRLKAAAMFRNQNNCIVKVRGRPIRAIVQNRAKAHAKRSSRPEQFNTRFRIGPEEKIQRPAIRQADPGGSESHADSERLARQSCREATLGMDCGAGEAAYKE